MVSLREPCTHLMECHLCRRADTIDLLHRTCHAVSCSHHEFSHWSQRAGWCWKSFTIQQSMRSVIITSKYTSSSHCHQRAACCCKSSTTRPFSQSMLVPILSFPLPSEGRLVVIILYKIYSLDHAKWHVSHNIY